MTSSILQVFLSLWEPTLANQGPLSLLLQAVGPGLNGPKTGGTLEM